MAWRTHHTLCQLALLAKHCAYSTRSRQCSHLFKTVWLAFLPWITTYQQKVRSIQNLSQIACSPDCASVELLACVKQQSKPLMCSDTGPFVRMCHSARVSCHISFEHCANSCTCKVCQYWLMSKSCCTYAIRAWHMMTSSGLVLLCSFWCHSSIIPPFKYHITHVTTIYQTCLQFAKKLE